MINKTDKTKNQRFLVYPSLLKKPDKRGSHVGVVLSFVIFITFIVFLYSIVSPRLESQQDKQDTLDHLRLELIERLSTNLTRVTISIDTGASPCIQLQNILTEAEIGPELIVKDEEETIQEIDVESNDLKIDRDSPTQDFFRIFYANEFEEPGDISGQCGELTFDDDYSISLLRTEAYVFTSKLDNLIEEYNADYDTLRQELKLPSGTEFAFSFVDSEGETTETGVRSISAEIYNRELPIQYVDEEANILLGTLNIKVW